MKHLFDVFDEKYKAYKLKPITYPVHIYVVLNDNNKFSVKHGSRTNTLYKDKEEIKYEDDIVGYSEQMFINGYFSCVITLGVNNEYFGKVKNKDRELRNTVVHEIQHVIGYVYERIDEQYKGNEHDAYFASHLYDTINEIIEYDTSLVTQ